MYGRTESIAKLSGGYFGLNLFILNIASAFANIVMGAVFTGGNEENAVLILMIFTIAAIFYIGSTLFLRKIKFEKLHNNS